MARFTPFRPPLSARTALSARTVTSIVESVTFDRPRFYVGGSGWPQTYLGAQSDAQLYVGAGILR